MDDEEMLAQLTRLCGNLGAENEQAEVMARQLLKRSRQLAQEQNISELESLDYLLRLVKSGREGVVPPQYPSQKGSSEAEK